ncbi:VOC family protein [Pendulispora albinea]|uniref:VOC family protein n=1 Tax=Pendulispora albinea TaxID=2741071 RepID=A0ABZ2M7P3_9BACT
METDGIEGLLIETHNWGKTVAFWKGLGYELEFETDHCSGQLRHPSGGPYIFVAERPKEQALKVQLAIGVRDAAKFAPPSAAVVVRPFERQHFPVLEMVLGDPDGREISVHAPLAGDAAKEKHHGG